MGLLRSFPCQFFVGMLATTLIFYIFPDLFLGRGAFGLSVLFSAIAR